MTRHDLRGLGVPDHLQYLENNSLPQLPAAVFTFILAGTLPQQGSLWSLRSSFLFFISSSDGLLSLKKLLPYPAPSP